MQLHLIFCLLHVQGQLKTSWSCSLERKDFHKSPAWYMSSLTRALLSVAKLQSQNDGRCPAQGNSLLWVCEIRVIPSDAGQSDETWCVFTQLLQVKISPNQLKKQRTGIVPKSLTSFAGYWRGVPFQSQSAGVTIGCHPFKGPGDDRMELKTVRLSDMLCFDTTWSNMQPHTGRPSRSCSWQNEFLKHADARIYWKQKCGFGIPKSAFVTITTICSNFQLCWQNIFELTHKVFVQNG